MASRGLFLGQPCYYSLPNSADAATAGKSLISDGAQVVEFGSAYSGTQSILVEFQEGGLDVGPGVLASLETTLDQPAFTAGYKFETLVFQGGANVTLVGGGTTLTMVLPGTLNRPISPGYYRGMATSGGGAVLHEFWIEIPLTGHPVLTFDAALPAGLVTITSFSCTYLSQATV